MKNARAISLICALALAAPLFAWRSELYPENWNPDAAGNFYTDKILQDFSYAGYNRGERAVPHVEGPVFDVTDAAYGADNTGSSDATSAIQKAIDAASAAGGGVVYLPAGTYKVDPKSYGQALHVYASNVVLRGAGPERTFVLCTSTAMRDKAIIRAYVDGNWTSPASGSPVAKFVSDQMKPTRSIPVNDVSGFAKGDWVVVRTDMTDAWISEHGESEGWGGHASSFTGLIYLRQVVSVDAANKRIEIDVPTRYAMKTRDNARIYKARPMIHDVGLEDFSIANVQTNKSNGWGEEDYKTSGTASYEIAWAYAIKMSMVRNSWISNVKSYRPAQNSSGAHLLANGIGLDNCRSITVRKCHFGNPQYGGGGGNGYMYRLNSQEILMDADSATYARHGFVMSNMVASGNVFLRVADKDGGHQRGVAGSGSTSGRGNDHHMHFSHSNLFDGCSAENSNFQAAYRPYGSVPKHNLTAAHSVYWNTEGKGNDGDTWVVHTQQARYGYAIGTRGSVNKVNTGAVGNSSSITAPVDHVEGIGTGADLQPQSLYYDQLARRLNRGVSRGRYGSSSAERVQAEDYDRGGEGTSWQETTQGNSGYAYCTDDVDLQRTADGAVALGWTATGEWLEYTVDFPTAGRYALTLRTSSNGDAGVVGFSVDGVPVADALAVPNSGGYQTYGEWTGADAIDLAAGEHVVRMTVVNQGFNVDWFGFAALPPDDGGEEGEGETAVSGVRVAAFPDLRAVAERGLVSVSGMPAGGSRVEVLGADGRALASTLAFGERADVGIGNASGTLFGRVSGPWGVATRRLAVGAR